MNGVVSFVSGVGWGNSPKVTRTSHQNGLAAAAVVPLETGSFGHDDLKERGGDAGRVRACRKATLGNHWLGVTLRLDMDLVEWFKRHAPEGGYQTEINRVLRRYVAGAGR